MTSAHSMVLSPWWHCCQALSTKVRCGHIVWAKCLDEGSHGSARLSADYLEESAEDPNSCLWDVMLPDKLQIQGPDAVMLGDGQSPQRTVQGPTCPCQLGLVHQKLTVVQPDARHLTKHAMNTTATEVNDLSHYSTWQQNAWEVTYLMHEDERSLKCIVDIFIARVSDTETMDLTSPQLQVCVPQLVAVWNHAHVTASDQSVDICDI